MADDFIDDSWFDVGEEAELVFYEDPYNHDNRMVHSMSFSTSLDNNAINLINNWMNTFKEWHLVPKTRPVVNPPKPITEYSTIKNVDGIIDFSESLDGNIHFERRTGTWEFAIDHELHPERSWNDIYDDMLQRLHGRTVRVTLQDDPTFYYQGRVWLNAFKSDKYWSEIAIDYELEPYKYSINTSGDYEWLFDEAIEERKKRLVFARFVVDGVKYRDFYSTSKTKVRPVIACTTLGITLETHYEESNFTVSLTRSSKTYKDVRFNYGHNYFTFRGNGIVSVYYNMGASL